MGRQLREFLELRYARYKEQLVMRSDDAVRGKAQELKELLKIV